MHRDGVDGAKAATLKNSYTINLNDQNLAKMMFVIGENSSTYESNKALTDKLNGIGNKLFPGLMKPTYVYEFAATSINQGLSNNSLLIEFGSNVNTSQEARLSAKYMARILAEHLNR
ncbi:stage II sporulation protein P, partial [Clostridium perfringens]|uniref:stage II sporulation protein P n=1 Tax=Clostridium perfringens TaxID=1502 RepID=UPI002ACC3530